MRTIIAGSRGLGKKSVDAAMDACPWTPTLILSGTARGVDLAGELWAHEHKLPVERYPADWSTGRGAGYQRNVLMAEHADALVAIWDGKSSGTKHMIDIARRKGLHLLVWQGE